MTDSEAWVIVNPLPVTLAHYEKELRDVIGLMPAGLVSEVRRVDEPVSELMVDASTMSKALRSFAILARRLFRPRQYSDGIVLVLWPAFGYLDVVSWLRIARSQTVVTIFHEVTPLKRNFGYDGFSHWVFRIASRHLRVIYICHTEAAQKELRNIAGTDSLVARHPFAEAPAVPVAANPQPVVSVLGFYKRTRNSSGLQSIGQSELRKECSLRILGHGWKPIEGWTVTSRFLSEEEFSLALRESDCVVLPYDKFYQSGVIVRALEALVPVVSRRHPQVEELFGRDWPGIVDDEDWPTAVRKALSTPPELLLARRQLVQDATAAEWEKALASVRGASGIRRGISIYE